MRKFFALMALMAAISGMGVSCSENTTTKKKVSADEAACEQYGSGTWNSSLKTCACVAGYSYDYTQRRCVTMPGGQNQLGQTTDIQTACLSAQSQGATWNPSTTQCVCPGGRVFDQTQRSCVTSGLTTGIGTPCATGQVMLGGACQSVSMITEQQGCGGTSGVWNGQYCQCPTGSTWVAALKTCQYQTSGGGLTGIDAAAAQVCQQTGGQYVGGSSMYGATQGQCQCPSGYQAQAQMTNTGTYVQACVSTSMFNNPQAMAAFAYTITMIMQQLGLR
jgi:hypothetical protein